MSDKQAEVGVPERYSRVDPWVISADSDAEIAFLEAAFGARETPGSRFADPEAQQAMGYVQDSLTAELSRGRWPSFRICGDGGPRF